MIPDESIQVSVGMGSQIPSWLQILLCLSAYKETAVQIKLKHALA